MPVGAGAPDGGYDAAQKVKASIVKGCVAPSLSAPEVEVSWASVKGRQLSVNVAVSVKGPVSKLDGVIV